MTSIKEKRQTRLVRQEDALGVYLQSLLGVNSSHSSQPEPNTTTTAIEPQAPQVAIDSSISPRKATGRRDRFIKRVSRKNLRCLRVTIGGLTVFIPTQMIGDIKKTQNELVPSKWLPSWIYEYKVDDDEPIQVINTQKLLFNGLKSQRLDLSKPVYVILIDDSAWGIACDSVGTLSTIEANQITWRSKQTRRRWLAGTVTGKGKGQPSGVVLDIRHIEKVLVSFT